jgi:hypothetical protein
MPAWILNTLKAKGSQERLLDWRVTRGRKAGPQNQRMDLIVAKTRAQRCRIREVGAVPKDGGGASQGVCGRQLV